MTERASIGETVRCPYCHRAAEFRESSESIYYGRNYGPIWICEPCQAWCGCHPGTQRPLGRLADAELRKAKMAAHAAFDPHWKTKGFSRATAYKYLAKALGIDADACHIGMFDAETCKKVVSVCPLDIPPDKRASARTVRRTKRQSFEYPLNSPGKNCGAVAVGYDHDLGIAVCREHQLLKERMA